MEVYSDFVKMMYENGFYVEKITIGLMSYEVICDHNKIVIVPAPLNSEDAIYIFTGTLQKSKILSEPSEFRLTLFDKHNREFKDGDSIMLSVVEIDTAGDNVHNLYTRDYTQWKFGQKFEKGIMLDSEKYLMFQTQKEIGKFDIDIINVDLFRRGHKIEKRDDIMMWLD